MCRSSRLGITYSRVPLFKVQTYGHSPPFCLFTTERLFPRAALGKGKRKFDTTIDSFLSPDLISIFIQSGWLEELRLVYLPTLIFASSPAPLLPTCFIFQSLPLYTTPPPHTHVELSSTCVSLVYPISYIVCCSHIYPSCS